MDFNSFCNIWEKSDAEIVGQKGTQNKVFEF